MQYRVVFLIKYLSNSAVLFQSPIPVGT